MDAKRIPFEQLPITNRFMFAMVFGHKEIAKPFLEAVLGIRIHELKDPEPEKTIDVSPFYKGIRYDVFVKETGPDGETLRSFDIEMQMEDNVDIPKRTRYYQAMCDSEALNKGEVYYKLNDLYIMFLCPEDIFGQGKAVYRFKNLEVDDPKIELGDLCYKNFYIFSKYRDVAEKSIREYLEYFATRNPSSPETKKIDRMVKWYQTDNETRKRYMTWQQEIDIAVDRERQRADNAERRFFEAKDRADNAEKLFFEAKARADEAEAHANEEKARADKYEKMLRELGKL
ncbi:MAG: Rpn family recombination-promoting nuclease/putative transposase [Fibrobacter sp.]|nr:Rpn family recombination-promoting nuclease/putative transposase [Fibrobacter sp.]